MSDWIMVIVTTAYVITTIVMCLFSYKQVLLSREQFEELKRQSKDDYMQRTKPEIDCEINRDDSDTPYVIRRGDKKGVLKSINIEIKNIGNGPAFDIQLKDVNGGCLFETDKLFFDKAITVKWEFYFDVVYSDVIRIFFRDGLGRLLFQNIIIMTHDDDTLNADFSIALTAPKFV